jgi:hypothetical protein
MRAAECLSERKLDDMTEKTELEVAVSKIAAELTPSGDVLYVFRPDDVQDDFFIGEEILVAASGALLAGFLKGLYESLNKGAEGWGKKVGSWLTDKMEGLFRKKDTVSNGEDPGGVGEDPGEVLDAVREKVAASSPTELSEALVQTHLALVDALVARGALQTEVAPIVDLIQREALTLIESRVS